MNGFLWTWRGAVLSDTMSDSWSQPLESTREGALPGWTTGWNDFQGPLPDFRSEATAVQPLQRQSPSP